MWLQAQRRPPENILHPLLFAGLMAPLQMLLKKSCLQVWWHLSDRTPKQRLSWAQCELRTPGPELPVLEDETCCNTVKLRPVPCWEPVCGEIGLGAAPLVLGCAHARLGPGEQWFWQSEPGCLTARSRWDHTL